MGEQCCCAINWGNPRSKRWRSISLYLNLYIKSRHFLGVAGNHRLKMLHRNPIVSFVQVNTNSPPPPPNPPPPRLLLLAHLFLSSMKVEEDALITSDHEMRSLKFRLTICNDISDVEEVTQLQYSIEESTHRKSITFPLLFFMFTFPSVFEKCHETV